MLWANLADSSRTVFLRGLIDLSTFTSQTVGVPPVRSVSDDRMCINTFSVERAVAVGGS